MNTPLFIARRYLFSRKSRNAINVISGISVVGLSLGTMALVIVLSVFNGFDETVKALFNSFDPDLKVIPKNGKTFVPENALLLEMDADADIASWSPVLEENALIRYGKKQYIAVIKGVNDDYAAITGIDSMMWDGNFSLRNENGNPMAVVGQGVANYLGVGLTFVNPLNIYVPRRTARYSPNPNQVFLRKYIFPSGIFAIEQDFDSKYILLPLDFTRELLQYEGEVSSLEVKAREGARLPELENRLQKAVGDQMDVRNRFEQQEVFYKVMRSEKLAIFFILTFILLIASFNITGSLTMLIIEKKRDIGILRSMGANNQLIKRIFLLEGWLISFLAVGSGLVLGSLICWLQDRYELIKIQGEAILITAYPVDLQAADLLSTALTVLAIGFLAAWLPVRYLSRKYLTNKSLILQKDV